MNSSNTVYLLLKILTLSLVLAASIGAWYLFRHQTLESSEFGRVTYKYRFGRPYEIAADVNRDGRIDYREFVSAPFGPASTHTMEPLEFWEDSDLDGRFDYHAICKFGVVEVVEIDTDGDGTYDNFLVGQKAIEFFEQRTLGRQDRD